MPKIIRLPNFCSGLLLIPALTSSASLSATSVTTGPVLLRSAMQRAANVEWRLLKAAGEACPTTSAAHGIVFDSLDAYSETDRAMVVRDLKISDLPQVAAVAKGSPADLAGILPGDDLVAINGTHSDVASETNSGEDDTLALRVSAALARLPNHQPVQMEVRRKKDVLSINLVPERLCASRIFVTTENRLNAYTDGANIAIPLRMVEFTLSDDELAILAGHELGHIIARDDEVSGRAEARRAEDRADITGADLAACAGYDTKSAASFWKRVEKSRPLQFLASKAQSPGNIRTQNVLNRSHPAQCPIVRVRLENQG